MDKLLFFGFALSIPFRLRFSILTQTPTSPDFFVQQIVIFALLPVLLAFSFLIFIFYRSRREAVFRKKETELQLQKAEVALKALKAQINPHFIFNCLNSIHHYMYSHSVAEAGNYLVKFSQQIRYALESSEQKWVPLIEEIESCKLYLELEQLRLNHSFSFTMDCIEGLDRESVQIPPMLIQPFLENAVWHGVAGGGSIEVCFRPLDNEHLACVIRDEPTGQASHQSDRDLRNHVKKTSMGIHLMEDRFNVLNQINTHRAGFAIEDRQDGKPGKEVQIRIPFES